MRQMMFTSVLLVAVCAFAAATRDTILLDVLDMHVSGPPPPPSPPMLAFSPVYGSNMLLERAPAKAAAYGVLGEGGTAVAVTVTGEGTGCCIPAFDFYIKKLQLILLFCCFDIALVVSGSSYTVDAVINGTYQPEGYVNPDGTPYPVVPSWKALLKPTVSV